MATYHQLTIWDVLDELSESPPTSSLDAMWDYLDAELESLPLDRGIVINRSACLQPNCGYS
ncbi:MAG: hypothetical protein ACYTXT_40075 [Nostoc sp.]